MKIAIWTYTAAVGFICLGEAALGAMFGQIFRYQLNGKPLPYITSAFLAFSPWALALPLAWLSAAIWLGRSNRLTPGRAHAFAGVSTLVISFLVTFAAIALPLPLTPIIERMK